MPNQHPYELPRRKRKVSAGHDPDGDLGALVQPHPGSFDDLVQLAADDDLVEGGDRGRVGLGENCPVCGDLGCVYFHLPAWARGEETVLDKHVPAAAWDHIAKVVAAWRVAENDGL